MIDKAKPEEEELQDEEPEEERIQRKFAHVDGKKELPDKRGMIKESLSEQGGEDDGHEEESAEDA